MCVIIMLMSSAYEVSCSGASGCVMSDVWVRGCCHEGRQFELALN